MFGASVDDVRQLAFLRLEVLDLCVSQRTYAEQPGGKLALRPPLVVGRGGQRSWLLRVAQDDAQPGRNGRVLDLEAPRVQEHRLPRPSHRRGHLVHDPAVHAHEEVLALLAELGERLVPNLEILKPVPDLSERHLQRRRGAHAAPHGDVARKHRMEVLPLVAVLTQRPPHPRRIPAPVVELTRSHRAEVERVGLAQLGRPHHGQIPRGRRRDPGLSVDRHREDETVVVVRVLADEVDPSGRHRDDLRLMAEALDELGSDAGCGHSGRCTRAGANRQICQPTRDHRPGISLVAEAGAQPLPKKRSPGHQAIHGVASAYG